MEILSQRQTEDWLRLDPGSETATLNMLEASAIDVVSHIVGFDLRTSDDEVQPALQHAIFVLVAAHYEDRNGAPDIAMETAKRLCAPWRIGRL